MLRYHTFCQTFIITMFWTLIFPSAMLNPFYVSGLFLYSLKTSENVWFPDLSPCVKNVQIWSFFWSVFPTFELNTEIYTVNLCIQLKYRKIRIRKISLFGHFTHSVRSSRSQTFFKISVLKNLLEYLFNKVAGLKACNFI